MDAPPAEVWDLVSDVTRIGEFSPETFEAKWTRGSTGPEVGAYFAGHVKRNGVGPTYWSPPGAWRRWWASPRRRTSRRASPRRCRRRRAGRSR